MDRNAPISDATITRNATRQLAGRGLRSPCHIQVQSRNGEVTLSGTVQFVHQRDAAVQAIRTVEGIKRIVEKLKVTPPAKHQYKQPSTAAVKTPAADVVASDAPIAASDAAREDSNEPQPLLETSPARHQHSPNATESFESSGQLGETLPATPGSLQVGIQHTRKGDSYIFECASQEEAERLRTLLSNYADWFKKNSWVGESKSGGGIHRVTLHAKSVIDFLRQAGF